MKPTWHFWNDLLQMTASLGCRLTLPLTHFHSEAFLLAGLQMHFLFSGASLHIAAYRLSGLPLCPSGPPTGSNSNSRLGAVMNIKSGEVLGLAMVSAPCFLTSIIDLFDGDMGHGAHAWTGQYGDIKTNFSLPLSPRLSPHYSEFRAPAWGCWTSTGSEKSGMRT